MVLSSVSDRPLVRAGIAEHISAPDRHYVAVLELATESMIEAFLEAVRSNEALQQQLRGVTTAAGLAEVAAAAGLTIDGAALVKGFAQLLLDSDDAVAVRNFDNLSWDMGELLWATKTWERPQP